MLVLYSLTPYKQGMRLVEYQRIYEVTACVDLKYFINKRGFAIYLKEL